MNPNLMFPWNLGLQCRPQLDSQNCPVKVDTHTSDADDNDDDDDAQVAH